MSVHDNADIIVISIGSNDTSIEHCIMEYHPISIINLIHRFFSQMRLPMDAITLSS